MKHALKSVVPNFALMVAIALVGNMIGGWLMPDLRSAGPARSATLTVQAVSITWLAAPGTSRTNSPTAPAVAVGSGFTCQGRLIATTLPADGSYDFVFTLWDAPSGGTRVAAPSSAANQRVAAGLFTVALDFGAGAFDGKARWLEIAVRASGGGSYTLLSPRQPIPSSP